MHVPQRENMIVNRLNKTKVEREVDHEQERLERQRKEQKEARARAAVQVRYQTTRAAFRALVSSVERAF